MTASDDDAPIGHVLARREVLVLFGTTAGAALLAAWAPGRRRPFGIAEAEAADPSCVVRPELTEGPYFVDERLNRSDIRSDPTTGDVRPGVPLALTFAVSRIDGSSCVPFEGVLVDVWHCDATGIYSDVQDTGFDTTGQKFLRGYQVTAADGTASFVTIYPGWYQGRTVHIHFKIRTAPDATSGLEFTSQLFFDDEQSDVVFAQPPYASRGERTVRNADDGIYQQGGEQLLLSPAADGSGGYGATFVLGVEASGSTTSTTTTTLADGGCATTAACLAALPNAAVSANRRTKRTARDLQRRATKLASVLERGTAASGARRRRLLSRAQTKLEGLLAASERAAAQGTLGVSLAPIQSAIESLLDLV
jgi:protocatechuate 3,4-dioxygenase beta subunit